jgi:hypothetical protein
MTFKAKLLILALLTIAACAAVMMLERIPQDPSYHAFADQRTMFGVPNFLNVASNFPFLIVGAIGILSMKRYRTEKIMIPVYAVLFLGIILTGLGSGYYHYSPNNDTLVWDRLPMTFVFMAFLSATIANRIHKKAGAYLLYSLLAAGIASVAWWHHTEQAGAGDLRAYALVQFYPMLFIPLVMLMFRSSDNDASFKFLGYVILWYAVAKASEHFDREILSFTHLISGHSLKHIFAAMATWFIVKLYIKQHAASVTGIPRS